MNGACPIDGEHSVYFNNSRNTSEGSNQQQSQSPACNNQPRCPGATAVNIQLNYEERNQRLYIGIYPAFLAKIPDADSGKTASGWRVNQ